MILDVSGPYHLGHDLLEEGKFMLIGSYTWAKPKGSCKEERKEAEDEVEKEEEEGPILEVEEEAPEAESFEEDSR